MRPSRSMASTIGALLIVGAAGCVVFDGLQPDNDAGRDASRTDAATKTDASGATEAGADAAGNEASTGPDASGGDDAAAPAPDGGANGVACQPGEPDCKGGPSGSCWAKPEATNPVTWKYTCAATSGYFQYECDDKDDCDAGDICCAAAPKSTGVVAYPQSTCRSTCPEGVILCRQSGNDCGPGKVCTSAATPYLLPPAYFHCESQ